jgi:hypothetical protein
LWVDCKCLTERLPRVTLTEFVIYITC